MIALKLGIRSLLRNRWRSGLTLAGIAVSVALMVWTLTLVDGWMGTMVRGATAVETAQVQVHTREYAENPRVYDGFAASRELLDRISAVPGVVALSPRIELHGLIGHERKSQVARIMGVDAEREAATSPLPEAVVAGRWLSSSPPAYPAPREVVLGKGVATQLGVQPGDELVVFLEAADGSLGNDLLRVVGVVETGNSTVDRMTTYMHLADAQFLAALDGRIHEIAIRAADLTHASELADAVAAAIGAERPGDDGTTSAGGPHETSPTGGPRGMARVGAGAPGAPTLLVRSWQELLPSVNQVLLISRRSMGFMYLLVYLIAAVGILNTQRMSALERRREFGVLIAIGMRPRRLFRTLVAETGVLGLGGAALGAALGFAASWYHATSGLDLSRFSDQATFTYMGVAFSGRLYSSLSAAAVMRPVLVMLVVALLSGLWPALTAARIRPASTIAGRT